MAAIGGVLGAPSPLTSAPGRVLWQPPVAPSAALASAPMGVTPIEIGPVSRAGGVFTVDWARAQKDANTVLAQINWSKPNIMIWVPGTSNHKVMPAFERAARAAYGPDASIAYLEYEATWDMRSSMPTGLATLLLVLQEIKKHKRPGQHVMLAGESQGAWIVGEAMANPLSSVVDRAALTGHPWVALHHYDDGQDPRVQEINHVGDEVTLPVKGDVGLGLDAMDAIHLVQLKKIGTVAKAIGANPLHGWLILKGLLDNLPFLKATAIKPHIYEYEMPEVVAFLHDGTRSPSLKPPLGATELAQYEAAA